MSNFFDSRANLKGKVAAVIGGGEGMGRAIVLALLENGVDVYMGDYNDEAMAITAEEAKAFPAKLVSKHVDVCIREEVKAYWDEFDSHFDHLELLFNVAGGTWHQEFLNTTPRFLGQAASQESDLLHREHLRGRQAHEGRRQGR